MMTPRIALFYSVLPTEIVSPPGKYMLRKEAWLKEVQATVLEPEHPKLVRVQYEVYDPEVQNMMRFFNGPCVAYYVIQDMGLLDRLPTPKELKQYREDILDQMLGYDFHTVRRVIHRRKSTADFKTVRNWYVFLEQLKETMFDPSGYEIPDSEWFWELAKKHGYDEAKSIAVKQLQDRLKKKGV